MGIIFFAFAPFLAQMVSADSGFMREGIWFSEENLAEGQSVKIYTLVWNGDPNKISGTVQFLDGATLLGSRDFSLEPETAGVFSIAWNVTAGNHDISAKIVNAKSLSSSGSQSVILDDSSLKASRIFIPKKIGTDSGTASGTPPGIALSPEEIKAAAEKLEESDPGGIVTAVKNAIARMDAFRDSQKDYLHEKAIEIRTEVAEEQARVAAPDLSAPSDSQGWLKTPFQYAKLIFIQLLAFIFSTRLAFYTAFFILAFLALKIVGNLFGNK